MRQQVVPTELQPSLEHLYERLVLDGNAQENWQAALALNGLSVVEGKIDSGAVTTVGGKLIKEADMAMLLRNTILYYLQQD